MADEVTRPKIELVEPSRAYDPTDIFDDLAALRKQTKPIVQRKSVLVNVTVERPPNNVYFRVHPSPDMQLRAAVVKNREGSSTTTYYIPPAMQKHPKLEKRLQLVTLALVTTWPVGNILIWPVPIPGTRDFKPWKSAYTAFERAQELWVQMVWNEAAGDYDVETAEGINCDPVFPDKSFNVLLKTGFADKVIDNENHPYMLQLRGVYDA